MQKPFYGWMLLFVLFVMYAANTNSTNTLQLFFPELKKAFGWSTQQVTAPVSNYFLYIAAVSPVVGWLLTRYSARRVMLLGSLLGIGTLGLFSQVRSLWQLHVVYLLFSVAITSAGIIPSMVILSNWFERFRGRAVGLFLVGSSFGGIVFPRLTAWLIARYGWREAALYLAVISIFFVVFPIFFLRNHPAELEQHPDGAPHPKRPIVAGELLAQGDTIQTTNSPTLLIALRSGRFYLLLFITASFWFCGFSVLQHSALYFSELGLRPAQAANVLSLFFLSSILGKVTFGYLSDHFNKLSILTAATVNLMAGLFFLRLMQTDTATFGVAFALLYGFGYSGAFAMIQLVVAELYQGAGFSRIYGVVTTTDSLAGFLGIATLAYLHDQSGSYSDGIRVLLLVAGLAFVGTLVLRLVYSRDSKPI
jgi:MFS transporter, OFA family, oxalate/formate antiporter